MGDERCGAAGVVRQVEPQILAEAGWQEVSPLLESERWRSGSGDRLGR